MQGFCPPSSRRQGAGVPRPVECDARTLSKERVQKRSPRLLRISETTAEKGEYLLALSPKREYKSVALAFSVFPKQRQKEGNICSVGCLPVHAIKTAHRAFVWLKGRCSASFVLAPALGFLHPLSWQKEQCNNARDSHGNHAELRFLFLFIGHLCNVAIFTGDRPHPLCAHLSGDDAVYIFLCFIDGAL